MQHLITRPGPLLDPEGRLREAGYATRPLLSYDRLAVRAPAKRIREWDRYLVANEDFALELTIADHSWMGVNTITFYSFSEGSRHTRSVPQFFQKGRRLLSTTSKIGDALAGGRGYSMEFRNGGNHRTLTFSMDRFAPGKSIRGEIILDCPDRDSLATATPFPGDPHAFHYSHKIHGMAASGTVHLGKKEYTFRHGTAYGALNWGRGVWTRNNEWLWAGASGLLDGSPFALNLGEGYGDTSAATENVLFYRGEAHKLEEVQLAIPRENTKINYGKTWNISSDDGRVDLVFEPVADHKIRMNLGFVCCDQHQIFGHFTGNVILNDGTVLDVPPLFGFAEKVCNKW